MLSHLRFHRRAPSNPTSPVPDQATPWEEQSQTTLEPSPLPDSRPRSSNAASTPPTLPPITRVTSGIFDTPVVAPQDSRSPPQPRDARSPPQQWEPRSPPQPRPYAGGDGFIGGVALQNYRKTLQNGHGGLDPTGPASAALPESALSRSKPPPPPINTGVNERRPPPVPMKQGRAQSSFVAPTDLHSGPSSAPGKAQATGKRPAGTRLTTEPASFAHLQGGSSSETPKEKGKRSLPFLKNPVSTLLMRRRTGHSLDAPEPLSLNPEPAYDPRIRGTRVHDFSAPRPRRVNPIASPEPMSGFRVQSSEGQQDAHAISSSVQTSLDTIPSGQAQPIQPAPSPLPPPPLVDSKPLSPTAPPIPAKSDHRRKISLDLKPVPAQQPQPQAQEGPPAPPAKDATASSTRTASTKSNRTSEDALSELPRTLPSTRSIMSRNVSASGRSVRDGVLVALPKHMKSTSSRFSFDMIGAARQEKLLEERHRQRELERKDSDPGPGVRDSRFEDMDDFDYDAMMDDDGLEERIPGVNADAEEDDYLYGEEDVPMIGEEEEIPMVGMDDMLDEEAEMDPDNDQENFAGFVFQRSNPNSELASPMSPGMLDTPRDDAGKVIGFAMTKDSSTPGGLGGSHLATSPILFADPSPEPKLEEAISGLGIEAPSLESHQRSPARISNITAPSEQPAMAPPPDSTQPTTGKDELYYDAGFVGDFADELDFEAEEPTGEPFDESIFDELDTDQYGRPIPGAFAQAQARRAAEREAAAKRESDMTSRQSAQSVLSESTAHTSISTDLPGAPVVPSSATDAAQPPVSAPDEVSTSPPLEKSSRDDRLPHLSSEDAMYQLALAEAAQRAALSGKFRRDSSPPPMPTNLLIISPTTASDAPHSGRSEAPEGYQEDYYEEDPYTQDMDDYDLDDDDIVAEANASALANDSDGWYGQEFGFYSNAPGHGHHSTSSSGGGSGNAALSAQNLYEYSNGGYFGPSGGLPIGRSASGRVVSREPNLTPITERSEYSNRNSIMSMGLPSAIGSGPDRSSLQSPGLAQLAMMADDGDMTLSSLLRLRSRAWGGSQASLVSSREGSPRSERPGPFQSPQSVVAGAGGEGPMSPWMSPAPAAQPHSSPFLGVHHGRKNSAFSAWSRDSDAGSGSGSPTMTVGGAFPPPSASPLLQTTTRSPSQSSNHQAHIASMMMMSSSSASSLSQLGGHTPSPGISPPDERPPSTGDKELGVRRPPSSGFSISKASSVHSDRNLSAFRANSITVDTPSASTPPPRLPTEAPATDLANSSSPAAPQTAMAKPTTLGHQHKMSTRSI